MVYYAFDLLHFDDFDLRAAPLVDAVAAELKSDPNIRIDLTFIIRNGDKKYPSVIDGRAHDGSAVQKKRARDVSSSLLKKVHAA